MEDKLTYYSPLLEIIRVKIEKGFATSPTGGLNDPDVDPPHNW